jgi:hypothetical protein
LGQHFWRQEEVIGQRPCGSEKVDEEENRQARQEHQDEDQQRQAVAEEEDPEEGEVKPAGRRAKAGQVSGQRPRRDRYHRPFRAAFSAFSARFAYF